MVYFTFTFTTIPILLQLKKKIGLITWFPTDSPRFFKLGVGECSEREMIFEILSFSLVGINVNYLLSEMMFNNAELLQAQRPHFNTMELC